MVLKGCKLLPETLLKLFERTGKITQASAEVFGVDFRFTTNRERFFGSGKNKREKLRTLGRDCENQTSGGAGDVTQVDGIRLVVMETHGTLKDMTKMLKELTLDESNPTLQFWEVRKAEN